MWSLFSRDPIKDFAYDIGDVVAGLEDKSIWKVRNGKKMGTGDPVTIFEFEIKGCSDALVTLAKQSSKRMKTLRHPNLLTYMDGIETDKFIYVVTEKVVPLEQYLAGDNKPNEMAISWGLYQTMRALAFLHGDCRLVHNGLCMYAVFVNQAAEWKLAAYDHMHGLDERYPPVKVLPLLDRYEPPERRSKSKHEPESSWAVDMWSLGCLIWEVFNGPLPSNASTLRQIDRIPRSLVPPYTSLVGANPKSRPPASQFLESCRKSPFFQNNLTVTMLFLEEIQIKEGQERNKFFSQLTQQVDEFPRECCQFKILPALIHAYEFGNAGAAVLPPLFKLSRFMAPEEYQAKVVPLVVKLFSSTDRATRARLLQQLDQFVEHLSPALINDKIFPQICQGFMDTNPVIREQTVKAMILLAPKLNYNNLNMELMKYFAQLQAKDDQGGIRTNTTICLGKIAGNLHPQVRQRVLIAAFTRALRDPFPPARQAGALAIAATDKYYSLRDAATKVMPALCAAMIDPEKTVRDQALRAAKGFIQSMEKASENPELIAEMEADVNSTSAVATSNESSWTGWAMSSLASRVSSLSKKAPKPSVVMNKGDEKLEKDAKKDDDGDDGFATVPQTVPKGATAQDHRRKLSDPKRHQVAVMQEEDEEEDEVEDEDNHRDDDDGEGWDDDDWGDMSNNEPASPKPVETKTRVEPSPSTFAAYEDRGSPQTSGAKATTTPTAKAAGALKLAQRLDAPKEEPAFSDSAVRSASGYNWGQTDDFFSTMVKEEQASKAAPSSKPSSSAASQKGKTTSDWEQDDWMNDWIQDAKKPKAPSKLSVRKTD